MSIEYKSAQEQTKRLEKTIASYQTRVANFQAQLSAAAGNETLEREIRLRIFPFQRQIELLEGDLLVAREEERVALEMAGIDPSFTIKSPDAINESQTDRETEEKYADPTNTPNFDPFEQSRLDAEAQYNALNGDKDPDDISNEGAVRENRSGVPAGAESPKSLTRASAEWAETKDLRVILRVPQSYLKGPASGPGKILNDFGGILFPYTPTISYDTQAQYGTVNPVHSNYTQYFFKNSQVGQISISAKFTVQNEKEGKVWLGIVHLLRSLTKMRFGKDSNAGSPPPVCRLEAYGDYMLRNVPVVVSSFKFDLPDTVDYISVGGEYKNSLVPSITTFNIGLNVGVKKHVGVGMFFFDITGAYSIFALTSNSLAADYGKELFSPLMFSVVPVMLLSSYACALPYTPKEPEEIGCP
jgi:hypothetical protein